MAKAALAFVAGLASFLSPCVLPLIPVYLAFLTGSSIEELKFHTPRRLVLAHAGFFILGFSSVFIAMGASASLIGRLLFGYREWVERLGGGALLVFGLWMLGALKIGFLSREARFHFHDKQAGLLGSALVGAAFAAGWTPCVGPALSVPLALAAREGTVLQGLLLLSAYSAGFALPLLLCALAVQRFGAFLKHIGPAFPVIEKATGALLMLMGLLLLTGSFARLSTRLMSLFPWWGSLYSRLGL